jgi:hypothetical protein
VAIVPRSHGCNVAGDTRVGEATMLQAFAGLVPTLDSSCACCSQAASLPLIRDARASGAGRLGMGLHDSMRRLAKIARRPHVPPLAHDFDLPQSQATALPASSSPPADAPAQYLALAVKVVPDLDPTSARCPALGCWPFRRALVVGAG